jgi:hypothetical protein
MIFQVQQFQAPKNGSEMKDCQDAIAYDVENGMYAIADGVSDSAFQQKWARLLVNSFVDQARAGEAITPVWIAQWLEAQQKIWQSQLNLETVPWHGRMKAGQIGAEATFLGIRLSPDRRSWSGIVIGDCNLFHFDKDCKFVQSVPFQRSNEFSNATQAFSSINKEYKQTIKQLKPIEGKIKTGDYLILTTDAMARWMLLRLEEKRNPLLEIPTVDDPAAFHRWVNAQRQNRRIKDDDTSLLLIQTDPHKVPTPTPDDPQKKREQIPGTGGTSVPVPSSWPSDPTTRKKPPAQRQVAAGVPVPVYLVSIFMVLIAGFFAGPMIQKSLNALRIATQQPSVQQTSVSQPGARQPSLQPTIAPQAGIQQPLAQLANANLPSREAYKQGLYSYIYNVDPVNGRVLICKADPAATFCGHGR